MYITKAKYYFGSDNTYIYKPLEIIKETNLYYITNECKIYKPKVGEVIFYYYMEESPNIEIMMIDVDEETLRNKLSKWLIDKATEVQEHYMRTNLW